MKKITSIIISILFLVSICSFPVSAEVITDIDFNSSNESGEQIQLNNPVLLQKKQFSYLPVSIVDRDNDGTSTTALGVTYYYFLISIWLIENGQKLYDTIEYISTVYDCASAINDFVNEYVLNEHITSSWTYTTEHSKTVVDTGCWTQDTPWNPFCRIKVESIAKKDI